MCQKAMSWVVDEKIVLCIRSWLKGQKVQSSTMYDDDIEEDDEFELYPPNPVSTSLGEVAPNFSTSHSEREQTRSWS